MSQQMFKVAAIVFHAAITQTFSPLINSVVDNAHRTTQQSDARAEYEKISK